MTRRQIMSNTILNDVYDETNSVIKTSAEIIASDIQIGAVEIKDGDSAVRLDVELDTTKNAAYVKSESLATSAKQLADGHNVTVDNASGGAAVNIQDGGNTITVDALNLDIRDLSSVSDSVEVLQDTATDLNATVVATDLDIRDLTHVSDSVKIGDGTDLVDVIAVGDDTTDLDDANALVTNAVLNGRISNTETRPLRIDSSTHSIQTIEYEHHEIHSGSSFVCADLRNVSTATFKWQVTTPGGTKYAHMVFDIDCTGEMTVLVTEGSDRVDGTALVEINRNRVGTPTGATVIVTHTPTGGETDGAITLINHRSGATGVGSKTISSGGLRGGNEFVLKPSTKYVISVTTYANVWVSLDIDWYEHEDKN